MKHPPYQLRVNKAIDRFLLIDVLQRISPALDQLADYSYFGFGGPFLEDLRLIHEYFPFMELFSFEKNGQTQKRQERHRFTRKLTISKTSFEHFLAGFQSTGSEVFWLDYLDLRVERIKEFYRLLDAVDDGAIVKLTLNVSGQENPWHRHPALGEQEFSAELQKFRTSFESQFEEFRPEFVTDENYRLEEFPSLVQKIIRIAAQRALPAESERTFQIVNSVFYDDGHRMLSVCGVVCSLDFAKTVRKTLAEWRFRNTNWASPKKIDVPNLSLRERLVLDRQLPVSENTGKLLLKSLGYRIGDTENESIEMLKQYADFYRFYPRFARVEF